MTPATTPSSATRDEKLAAIKTVCIKANPEIVFQHSPKCCCGCKGKDTSYRRPIRLADVLLALQGKCRNGLVIDDAGHFLKDVPYDGYSPTGFCWNLRADSLDAQNDDSINFLHSLLIS